MTAPDACEWYALDPHKSVSSEMDAAILKFHAAHPTAQFGRFTVLGVDRWEPCLCIEGWRTSPDDQGPAPTDADIPAGLFRDAGPPGGPGGGHV